MSRRKASRRSPALAMLLWASLLAGCSVRSSDTSILRSEFEVPGAATVVSYEASPSESGWFGREGLKIDIVFQLSEDDYAGYVARAQEAGTWGPLPIPEAFLRRMGGIETARAARARSYEAQGRPLPEEGSFYNPTESQMLETFKASLPPEPEAGLFQVRTAGNDIMRAPKTILTDPDRDLNDFMLAVLDHGRRRIVIQVSTGY